MTFFREDLTQIYIILRTFVYQKKQSIIDYETYICYFAFIDYKCLQQR